MTTAPITSNMLHLLHHTLGLTQDRRIPYRNHFVAGPGHHDMTDLEALEQAGLMKRTKTPAFCDKQDVVFVCTVAGKDYAIEHLPLPPTRPKRSNYDDYLDADCGHSFADWLNINRPLYEHRCVHGKWECRMYRRNRLYTWGEWGAVSGEWKPTKKEAKSSYKDALALHRASRKSGHG